MDIDVAHIRERCHGVCQEAIETILKLEEQNSKLRAMLERIDIQLSNRTDKVIVKLRSEITEALDSLTREEAIRRKLICTPE